MDIPKNFVVEESLPRVVSISQKQEERPALGEDAKEVIEYLEYLLKVARNEGISHLVVVREDADSKAAIGISGNTTNPHAMWHTLAKCLPDLYEDLYGLGEGITDPEGGG